MSHPPTAFRPESDGARFAAMVPALAWVLGVFLILAPVAGSAQSVPTDRPPPSKRLEKVEGALDDTKRRADALAERSRSLDGELDRIRRRLVDAASATQAHEATLTETEGRLAALAADAEQARARLAALRGRLTTLSGAAQRFAYRPPEALLASDLPPVETVRSAMVMRYALASLTEVVRETNTSLARLTAIQTEIAAERENAQVAADRLTAERELLAALMQEKAALRQRTSSDRADVEARIRELGRAAESLRGLVDSLQQRGDDRLAETDRLARSFRPPSASAESAAGGAVALPRERPTGSDSFVAVLPDGPSIESAKGALSQPVAGRLVERFGRRDDAGITSRGLTFETRAGAQVVATFDGTVIYAGPFRGYGEIVIIEHGDGYHSLVAGMGRIDLSVGQGVLAGEPIGVMPPAGSHGGSEGPRLYMELRHDGDPIDPLAWLAQRRIEVRG